MARFYGKVGYAESVEESPGVFVEHIVEYKYYGQVLRNSRTLTEGEQVNPDLSLGNSISIIADPYGRGNFGSIRYVEWMGILWKVSLVEVQIPRLILTLGEVYRGPTP